MLFARNAKKIKDAVDKNGDVDGTCRWGIALVIQMPDFSGKNIISIQTITLANHCVSKLLVICNLKYGNWRMLFCVVNYIRSMSTSFNSLKRKICSIFYFSSTKKSFPVFLMGWNFRYWFNDLFVYTVHKEIVWLTSWKLHSSIYWIKNWNL